MTLSTAAAASASCASPHPPPVRPASPLPSTAPASSTSTSLGPSSSLASSGVPDGSGGKLAGHAPARTFAVRTQRFSLARGADRPLPTTIWRPATDGVYPLVLFSHGLQATPRAYDELLTTWAKAGFVIAAPAYPHTAAGVARFNPVDVVNQPADASHVITEVVKRLGGTGPIAAAGHSAGGVTTLGLFAGARDERLKAGVILAGRQIFTTPLTGARTPLLFVHGKLDRTVAYADGHAVYDAVSWPKAFLTVTDGGHTPTGRELDVVAGTSTDFLRWSLYGDTAARARLPRDATRGDVATLDDRL